jgi:hypothetical protein
MDDCVLNIGAVVNYWHFGTASSDFHRSPAKSAAKFIIYPDAATTATATATTGSPAGCPASQRNRK